MLKQEENELICRVGAGTPMGNFMREYWVPAGLSSGARLRVEMAGRGYLITVDPLTGRVATRRLDA